MSNTAAKNLKAKHMEENMRLSKIFKSIFITFVIVMLGCVGLVACAQPVRENITITFLANCDDGAFAFQETNGIDFRLDYNQFVRDGYAFKGWNSSIANANLGKVEYEDTVYCYMDADVTLFAVWEKIEALEYSFNQFSKTAKITEASKSIKKISVPTTVKDELGVTYTVTSIGDEAFMLNYALETLIFEEDSQLKSIGNNAFYQCGSLKVLRLPNSIVSIGNSAFSGCRELVRMTIPYGVKEINNGVFFECNSLSSIIISNSVTAIGDSAFQYCTALKEIIIPDSVIAIDYNAFRDCTALENIIIPDSVIAIGYNAFRDCTALENIIMPNSLKAIEDTTFQGCVALTEITIPNTVTTIGSNAFNDCSELISITIPNSVASLKIDDYRRSLFDGCIKLEAINVDEGNLNYSSIDGVLFNKNKEILVSYPQGKLSVNYVVPSSTETIKMFAFSGNTGLRHIKTPSTLKYIQSYAFADCLLLYEVIIAEGLLSLGDNIFDGCIELTSISLPATLKYIQSYAFAGCTKLEGIHVAEGNSKYASIDGVLFNHDKTELITYPQGKKTSTYVVPNSVIKIRKNAFSKCDLVTKIVFQDGGTTIDSNAFNGCTGLTSIIIPASVTYIGEYAFKGCDSMNNIYMVKENSNGMILENGWNDYSEYEDGGRIDVTWGYKA